MERGEGSQNGNNNRYAIAEFPAVIGFLFRLGKLSPSWEPYFFLSHVRQAAVLAQGRTHLIACPLRDNIPQLGIKMLASGRECNITVAT
jgi:hypothetical protein